TKVLIKGKVPVDPQCTAKVDSAHVLQIDDDVYHFMLNQTNLQHNNNKYYVGQVLRDDFGGGYAVWFRWGRVGKTAQTSLQQVFAQDRAIALFKSKFRSKTGNLWENRHNFTKVSGLYDLIEQDFGVSLRSGFRSYLFEDDTNDNDTKEEAPKKQVESLLPPEVFALIALISDVRDMERQMREMNYDARRAPLGKLTQSQIKAGYQALNDVSDCLEELKKLTATDSTTTTGKKTRNVKRKSSDASLKRAIQDRLLQACNNFYTRIPHDFGMRVPPLIDTPDALKTELDLLKALEDIEVAFSIIEMDKNITDLHPADRNYNNLHCDIKPIKAGAKMERIIKDYIRMTHAPTHDSYELEVLQTFELCKSGETEVFKDYGRRWLLWHGSRMSNWMGILGRGLKIAPPEAPSTGYMFGKGVYFADCASKSANYTHVTSSNDIGIMALCEVSLGECNELLNADYNANNLPSGKHSVKGLGSHMTDPSTWITLDDGVVVPSGKIIASNVKDACLFYNEYIVYDIRQIRLRYLVQLKFHYKY
ncbi:unnamed protein product, partial [Mesocestoides corti]